MRLPGETISTRILPVLLLSGLASATTLDAGARIALTRQDRKCLGCVYSTVDLPVEAATISTIVNAYDLGSGFPVGFNPHTEAIVDETERLPAYLVTGAVMFEVTDVGRIRFRLNDSEDYDV